MDFTDQELQHINRERRKKGMRQLSRRDAERAREVHAADNGSMDLPTFLLLFSDFNRTDDSPAPTQAAEVDYQSFNAPAYDPPQAAAESSHHTSTDTGSSGGGDSGGGSD